MALNLKEKCDQSKNREFFYGAKINKDIKDVYLGLGYLEPGETGRKQGPGRGHEELLYAVDGQIEVTIKKEISILNEGEIYFIPDGSKVKLRNILDKRVHFMIAGGHTTPHRH